jgi:hypothetical protein
MKFIFIDDWRSRFGFRLLKPADSLKELISEMKNIIPKNMSMRITGKYYAGYGISYED